MSGSDGPRVGIGDANAGQTLDRQAKREAVLMPGQVRRQGRQRGCALAVVLGGSGVGTHAAQLGPLVPWLTQLLGYCN
jgi:hypothetical protein